MKMRMKTMKKSQNNKKAFKRLKKVSDFHAICKNCYANAHFQYWLYEGRRCHICAFCKFVFQTSKEARKKFTISIRDMGFLKAWCIKFIMRPYRRICLKLKKKLN